MGAARLADRRVANILASLPRLVALPCTSRWNRGGRQYQQAVLGQIRDMLESLRRRHPESLEHPAARSARDLLARFDCLLPADTRTATATVAGGRLADPTSRQARGVTNAPKERRPTGIIIRRRGASKEERPSDSTTMPSVRRVVHGQWEWFVTTLDVPYSITGKYLFFSADRSQLVSIAIDELRGGTFHLARIQAERGRDVTEFVLALYYQDGSRGTELAERYRGCRTIRFRSWQIDKPKHGTPDHERFLRFLRNEASVRTQHAGTGTF